MAEMSVVDVLESFEEYYGKYPRPLIRDYVRQYLEDFSDEELFILHAKVILNVTTNRFTIPDVATIENVKQSINRERQDRRQEPIGKTVVEWTRKPKICPKCGKEYIGTACTKCGWSKATEEAHGSV